MQLHFLLLALPHCNYCDEAGKYFNMKLFKKYPGIGFSVLVLDEERMNKMLCQEPDLTFPVLNVCKAEYGALTVVDKIYGTLYKDDIENFVKECVKKYKEED